MIYGIGIDIIKVERMRTSAERWGKRLLRRVFTKNEIDYCYAKRDPYLSLAVRFAAKEALIKALRPGAPVSLREIEVINDDQGRPLLIVRGELEAFFRRESLRCAHVSLSHEREYGIACVVLER